MKITIETLYYAVYVTSSGRKEESQGFETEYEAVKFLRNIEDIGLSYDLRYVEKREIKTEVTITM